MRRKQKRGAVLGSRDYEILKDLFYCKVCDLEYIYQKYFKGRHITAARKRLDRLFKGGFLKKIGVFDLGARRNAYSITPLGLDAIVTVLPDVPSRKECFSANVLHDLELAQIKRCLDGSSIVKESKSENELQSFDFYAGDKDYEPFRRLNSDLYAYLFSDPKSYRVAVEYERSAKSPSRWRKYLLNYHLENQIDAALYVCHDHLVRSSLESVEKEFVKDFSAKIYFADLKQFQGDSRSAKFTNILGENFTIDFQL